MIEDTLQELIYHLNKLPPDIRRFRKGEIYLELVETMTEIDEIYRRYSIESDKLIGGKDD